MLDRSLSGRSGPPIHNDRVGPRGTTIGTPAKVQHPPPIGSIVGDAEDGYANASPMETTKRFPQGFGNLATNARFPHSHSHDSLSEREKNSRPEDNNLINN
jgi:hypothetical protein